MISDRDLAQFHDLGYFITRPAIDPELLASARREFERLWREDIAAAEASGDEGRIRIARHRAFIGQAHARSEVLTELCHAAIYREACAKLIGPDADLYWNQVVIKSPQRGAHFGWHQDSGYTTTIPLAYITCWTAITRATQANGCIWVIPGSHHQGLRPHRTNQQESSYDAVISDETGAIPVELEPGQVAIFSSLLLHKSGPNTSDEVRFGYVPQYHHQHARSADSGDLLGDQVPVLRGGRAVAENVALA
jgi:ectoine hydroxylase-related dioxygenase (phytanoyl-CoA dioxygenase family)